MEETYKKVFDNLSCFLFFILAVSFATGLVINNKKLNEVKSQNEQYHKAIKDLHDKMADMKKRNGYWKNEKWHRCVKYDETPVTEFVREDEKL